MAATGHIQYQFRKSWELHANISVGMRFEAVLDSAPNKLEDLKAADKDFKEWMRMDSWDDDQQEIVNKYYKKLKDALGSMIEAITSMDAPDGIGPDHFDKAFQFYGEGPENIPNKYVRELTKLIHDVEKREFQWYPYTTAVSHYIHWGSINCSLPTTEPVYVGYAASSPKGFGSGSSLLCLDVEPLMDSMELDEDTPKSYLNGLTYESTNKETGPAYCAFCKLGNASAVITMIGRSDCPSDMKLEYSGFLVTNHRAISQPICFDYHPDDKIVDLHSQEDKFAGKLAPLWMMCKECEEDEEEEKARYMSCAVCSR
ncbi:uncharacterized protein TNIN_482111 [Trichonephila inaurata madagascariensis]|uniref:Uncharacterized protein n=1 Tax=Trichonephila inaurata madagascariensis TaxID=2747483 RepID=A0A8X6Y9D7_9ARAC|nr:uncharacterized protein TNIN_482111 [Trichonephila inaurata madagascariensis]